MVPSSIIKMKYVIIVTIIAFILSYNIFPQYGSTALHWASEKGHPEAVKTLVQSHADVNVRDDVSTESPHQYHCGKFTIKIFLLPREVTEITKIQC
jgi:hypothetical protein